MVTRTRGANEIAAAPPTKTKVNVLLVDDDATKRFALRTILAPLDENIVEASSGADALRQLTVDHSKVQEMVDAGLLRPEDMAGHPLSHIVTRSIGGGRLELGMLRDALQPGDRFLLCSDGLTNMVAGSEIAREIGTAAPSEAAQRLLDLVLARGAIDNVTIVIVTAGSAV